MPTDIERARRKYKPKHIKFLLVAEAPPQEDSGRFFYFEDVSEQDGLFLNIMQVLYPKDYTITKIVRLQKRKFLQKFQADGFYLIDACDTPMKDASPTAKQHQIRECLPSLRAKLKNLATDALGIVLISATVYNVCSGTLKDEGFNILNEDLIDFPGSGRQLLFREKFSNLLGKQGWINDA